MFDSSIIDFCIGMTFFYVVLTLICTMINEYVMGWLNLRAKSLLEGISGLFYDADMIVKLYTHPLVRGLYRDEKQPIIPENKSNESSEEQKRSDLSIKSSVKDCVKPFEKMIRNLPSYIPSSVFAMALIDILTPVDKDGKRSDLRNEAISRRTERINNVLLTFIDEAQGDIEKVRKGIEKYFDNTMDRVSGWFKRKARFLLLAVASFVCLVLNADSITVGKMLWQDKELRAVLVAQAEEYKPEAFFAKEDGKKAPISDTSSRHREFSKGIEDMMGKLSPFPMGWIIPTQWRGCMPKWMGLSEAGSLKDPREIPTKPVDIIFKLIGLFFTVLAVSLGAPFWTDLLNSFVNLRKTGKVPVKSGERKG